MYSSSTVNVYSQFISLLIFHGISSSMLSLLLEILEMLIACSRLWLKIMDLATEVNFVRREGCSSSVQDIITED